MGDFRKKVVTYFGLLLKKCLSPPFLLLLYSLVVSAWAFICLGVLFWLIIGCGMV